MPQGVAAVVWNEQKDIQLFLTILAVQKVNVDYNAVAAAFGKSYFSLSALNFRSGPSAPTSSRPPQEIFQVNSKEHFLSQPY
jgi:hypothetical protein